MKTIFALKRKVIKFWVLLSHAKFIHIFILLSAYLPRKVWHLNLFYILMLNDFSFEVKEEQRIRINVADETDMRHLCEIEDKYQIFKQRFEKRDLCFLAEVDGKPVGYLWMCKQDQYFDELNNYTISLKDGVWYFDSLISSNHRNRGIWKHLMAEVIRVANDLGRRKIYCMVEYVNDLSLLVHNKFGFEIIQRVIYLSFLGKKIHIKKSYLNNPNR